MGISKFPEILEKLSMRKQCVPGSFLPPPRHTREPGNKARHNTNLALSPSPHTPKDRPGTPACTCTNIQYTHMYMYCTLGTCTNHKCLFHINEQELVGQSCSRQSGYKLCAKGG